MLPPLPRTLMAGLATLLLTAATAPGLEPAARIEQLKAKAATGQKGAPALVAALKDPQQQVRVAALELLATVKGRAAVPDIALLRKLAQEPVETLRSATRRALQAIGA